MSVWQPFLDADADDGSRLIFGTDPGDRTSLAFWHEGRTDPVALDPAEPVHVLWVKVGGREQVMFAGDNLGHPSVERVALTTPGDEQLMAHFNPEQPVDHYYRPLWFTRPETLPKPAVVEVRWYAQRDYGWRAVHIEHLLLED